MKKQIPLVLSTSLLFSGVHLSAQRQETFTGSVNGPAMYQLIQNHPELKEYVLDGDFAKHVWINDVGLYLYLRETMPDQVVEARNLSPEEMQRARHEAKQWRERLRHTELPGHAQRPSIVRSPAPEASYAVHDPEVLQRQIHELKHQLMQEQDPSQRAALEERLRALLRISNSSSTQNLKH